MKFYIAARWSLKQKVRAIHKSLKRIGHEVVGDWTLHKPIKPYDQNKILSKQYSIEDIQGVRDCDIFLLLSSENGTGMYIELGAAILSHLEHGKPKIYIIGNYNSRSMFYFHPSVNRRKNLDEVLNEIDK